MTRASFWFLCMLLVALAAPLALAGSDDAASGNSSTAKTTPASPKSEAPATTTVTNGSLANTNANVTALLGVLVMKEVLSPAEAKSIQAAAPGAEFQALVDVLTRKGVMSSADLNAALALHSPGNISAVALHSPPSSSVTVPSTQPAEMAASLETADVSDAQLGGPEHPTVVPAVAPVRVLPLDPPAKDGLKAAFKMGPVKMTPYGFIKTTAEYDTSSPNGDDFPFVGLFLSSTAVTSTGPPRTRNSTSRPARPALAPILNGRMRASLFLPGASKATMRATSARWTIATFPLFAATHSNCAWLMPV